MKQEDEPMDDAEKCQRTRCTAKGEPLHGCPYQEDVNDNYEFRCNCCDECRHECAMDI